MKEVPGFCFESYRLILALTVNLPPGFFTSQILGWNMHNLLKDILISIPTKTHLTLGYRSTGEGGRQGRKRRKEKARISKN